MAGGVRFTLNKGATSKVLGGVSKRAAYNAAQKLRGRAMSNVRKKGRIDTGKMLNSIQVRRTGAAGEYAAKYVVGSTADYAAYQEFGTAAHGPRNAKVMVFTPKGGGGKVFATWVRGVTAAHFMRDAMRKARAEDARGR